MKKKEKKGGGGGAVLHTHSHSILYYRKKTLLYKKKEEGRRRRRRRRPQKVFVLCVNKYSTYYERTNETKKNRPPLFPTRKKTHTLHTLHTHTLCAPPLLCDDTISDVRYYEEEEEE